MKGTPPTKASDTLYQYTFDGWTPAITIALSDATYIAVFKQTSIISDGFDGSRLDDILGEAFYQYLPIIISSNYDIVLDDEYNEVYVDIFDWTYDDALNYQDELDQLYTYNETEMAYLIGNYYVYIYEDDTLIPGELVYGLGIYLADIKPIEDGVYYQFNVQDTTTTLSNSYKDGQHVLLTYPTGSDKVTVYGNNIADVTTAPAGLSAGIIFAASAKITNPQAYLELDTKGVIISKITFSFEGRTDVKSGIKDAKVQVYQNNVWTDLPNSSFLHQIQDGAVTVTLENLNASHFRVVFIGSSSTKNSGQFKINDVTLYGEVIPVVYTTWKEVTDELGYRFNYAELGLVLIEYPNITDITIQSVANKQQVSATSLATNSNDDYVAYKHLLLSNGWQKDDDLTLDHGEDVYVFEMNENQKLAIKPTLNGKEILLEIWSYVTNIKPVTLETLSNMQSINEMEVESFGKSGLPSTGTYHVLVIPIEINNVAFPANYDSQLEKVFNGNQQSTGWESVSSYYQKSSYGLLNLTFDIGNKYQTKYSASHYEKEGQEADQIIIKEALLAQDADIDFSQYDSNKDDIIDSIIFIYSYDYNYDVDPWWAWVYAAKYGVTDDLDNLDNKEFEYYMWASYHFMLDSITGLSGLIVNAETYIHELGHLMGIEDFYSTRYDYGAVGGFDMMDHNAGDHGPFNKLIFGWLQPLYGTKGIYQVSLESYSLDADGKNSAIIIPNPSSNLLDGDAFDEYILIIFYTPNGLYSGHKGLSHVPSQAGVIVYHIDARLNNTLNFWEGYFLKENLDATTQFQNRILEADENNSLLGSTPFSTSDMLRSGIFDLSSYRWNQGGNINVSIEIANTFNNDSNQVLLNLNVGA